MNSNRKTKDAGKQSLRSPEKWTHNPIITKESAPTQTEKTSGPSSISEMKGARKTTTCNLQGYGCREGGIAGRHGLLWAFWKAEDSSSIPSLSKEKELEGESQEKGTRSAGSSLVGGPVERKEDGKGLEDQSVQDRRLVKQDQNSVHKVNSAAQQEEEKRSLTFTSHKKGNRPGRRRRRRARGALKKRGG